MDPASIAGLILQVSQLALQSSTALYQFVRDAQNVNANIEDLISELCSLGDICKIVHGQLRTIARRYRCREEEDKEDISLWMSIQNTLNGCNVTRQILEDALGRLRYGGSNIVTQGLRQFRLNLKQHEINTMKARIQSHTSALQVCLLVMDM